jgi:hypothetical protein
MIRGKVKTVKQLLWSILFLSSLSKILLLFLLPSTPSRLAPDEGTYAVLSKWIANSQPANEFPYLGELLYLNGRSLIAPSSVLVRSGIHEQYSVRLVAVTYSILSALLILYFLTKYFPNINEKLKKEWNQLLVITLFAVFNFLPSRFLWSTLGLRESPNEFWIIAAFFGVFLFYRQDQPRKLLVALLVAISIVCTFTSRPQVGWVLVASIFTFSLFKLREKLTYLLIISVCTGLFTGYVATTPTGYVSSDLYVDK